MESVLGEGSSFQFSARVPVLLNYLTVKTRLFSSLVEVDRIILITDSEKAREVLGKQLTSFGLAVIPVSGTKNARDVFQQIQSTDVIIIEYDSLQNNTELKEYLSDRTLSMYCSNRFKCRGYHVTWRLHSPAKTGKMYETHSRPTDGPERIQRDQYQ